MNDNLRNTENTAKKKAKKKLLIAMCVIAGLIIVLLVSSFIIDLVESKKDTVGEIDYNFYPADFDEDIFEDEKYLELTAGEFMRYCDSTTNLTVGIDRESAIDQGSEVEFLCEMIYDVIYGDHEAYNSRFSDLYYESNVPKNEFTMQKIYDVTITYISRETVSDESGDNYTKSIFIVEYKIYQNNGTFRRDIGAGSKKQYFTMTDKSGELLIDHVSTVNAQR